jgi:hypothetical protein
MHRAPAASLEWGFASINSRLTANRLTSRSWPSRFGAGGIVRRLPLPRVLRRRRPRDPRRGPQRLRPSRLARRLLRPSQLARRQFRRLPPSLREDRRKAMSSTQLARLRLLTGRPASTLSRQTKRVALLQARGLPKKRHLGYPSKTPAQIRRFRSRLPHCGPSPSTSAKKPVRRLPLALPHERPQLIGAGLRARATSWRPPAWTSHLTTALCPYRSPIIGRPRGRRLRPHPRQARVVGSIER